MVETTRQLLIEIAPQSKQYYMLKLGDGHTKMEGGGVNTDMRVHYINLQSLISYEFLSLHSFLTKNIT